MNIRQPKRGGQPPATSSASLALRTRASCLHKVLQLEVERIGFPSLDSLFQVLGGADRQRGGGGGAVRQLLLTRSSRHHGRRGRLVVEDGEGINSRRRLRQVGQRVGYAGIASCWGAHVKQRHQGLGAGGCGLGLVVMTVGRICWGGGGGREVR